jgi:hypothetical protein
MAAVPPAASAHETGSTASRNALLPLILQAGGQLTAPSISAWNERPDLLRMRFWILEPITLDAESGTGSIPFSRNWRKLFQICAGAKFETASGHHQI